MSEIIDATRKRVAIIRKRYRMIQGDAPVVVNPPDIRIGFYELRWLIDNVEFLLRLTSEEIKRANDAEEEVRRLKAGPV